jgi:hypothetical protein
MADQDWEKLEPESVYVADFPENFIRIIVSGQYKHYIKLVSKKDQIAYQSTASI